jgi:hypothetical protein
MHGNASFERIHVVVDGDAVSPRRRPIDGFAASAWRAQCGGGSGTANLKRGCLAEELSQSRKELQTLVRAFLFAFLGTLPSLVSVCHLTPSR